MRQGDKDVLIAQLYCVSCKPDTGLASGVSYLCTGNSQPSCSCYPSFRDLGMIVSKTTFRDQTFARTYACLICSNHSPWVRQSLSNPCSWFSSLNRCHQRSFTWVMYSHLGRNRVHKNSSRPLTTSAEVLLLLQIKTITTLDSNETPINIFLDLSKQLIL